MQVDPVKPTLKPPGTKRLILVYDELLSNFAFHFNLRRSNLVPFGGVTLDLLPVTARGVHGRGLTLVHYSAQPEPFLSLKLNNYSLKSAYVELNSARV